MKPLQIILLALVGLLLIAAAYLGYTYFGFSKNTPIPVPQASTQANQDETTFKGTMETLVNLPGDTFKDPDGAPSGLKTDNGDFYLLVGDNVNGNLLAPGQKVMVIGIIDPSVTVDHYQVKGVIRVTSMEAL